jgi:hypothetical protein
MSQPKTRCLALLVLAAICMLPSPTSADRDSNDSSQPQTMTAAPLPGGGTQDDLLKWALGACVPLLPLLPHMLAFDRAH